MTVSINFVITNSGDGSNGIHWVRDEAILEKMEQLVEDGDDQYSSGDGLQVHTLVFPDGFDLDAWIQMNHLYLPTLANR